MVLRVRVWGYWDISKCVRGLLITLFVFESHFSPDNRIEQILQPKEDKVVSASSLNTTIAGPPSIITGPPEILASSGALATSYQPNAYAPLEQSFHYGGYISGYENNAGNWGEYPNYVNSNNLQIIPPAMFNDNSSLFYPSGYSFDTQMAYGQFPPLASPMSPFLVDGICEECSEQVSMEEFAIVLAKHFTSFYQQAIMDKSGDADDCLLTLEAVDLASKLSEEELKNLPLPGQVDFINGGPSCQGYSGMHRFNQSFWSKVLCEMILAFLSFADYYRPKFGLVYLKLEHLEACLYGSPEETLLEWPEPMHAFSAPELKVALSGNKHYAAVRSTQAGAPFRAITL
ncbi:hypothetical protein ACET3Z_030920 [Daucus carota]